MVSTRGSRSAVKAPADDRAPTLKPVKTPRRVGAAGHSAGLLASPPTSPRQPGSGKNIRRVPATPEVIRFDQAVAEAAATPLPGDDDGDGPGTPLTLFATPLTPPSGRGRAAAGRGRADAGGASPVRASPAATPKAAAGKAAVAGGSKRGTSKAAAAARGDKGAKAAKAAGGGGGAPTWRRAALVLLAVAALAAGGLFYAERLAPSSALQFPGSAAARGAPTRAAVALARLRARGGAAREWLERRAAPLLAGLRGGGAAFIDHDAQHAAGAGAPRWDAAQIAALLPEGAAWRELAEDVAERLNGGGGATAAGGAGRKGAGLLLACATAADCAGAAAALGGLSGPRPGCVLQLDGLEFSSDGAAAAGAPAAALQGALAPFLRRCPAGLVVLRDAQHLGLEALPALHSALSELGGFQHGGPVDASRGAYVLLAQLDSAAAAAAAAAAEPADAGARLKALFFDEVLGAELGAAPDAARAGGVLAPMLRALRRRVDFAAPLRLSAAAAAEAAEEAAVMAEEDAGAGAAYEEEEGGGSEPGEGAASEASEEGSDAFESADEGGEAGAREQDSDSDSDEY
ncbi:MAG: hypothetical protein J3K34DRAFT_519645 [Monoraphidium minutum]|nr:MAG: hypothetical protein J3K34DRAFT_519645 [Monoraphidium minutum]